ncbi:Hypothetical predicted protein [Podarcis lilfordi]|uniref:Uncharacterized protein n=1 Tax=Podarcis lilfordi TaxID=74358 RepID=A0AA35JST3_9SAUR|nr:Hypothetical predicted protein [Podarcis lilfordi]
MYYDQGRRKGGAGVAACAGGNNPSPWANLLGTPGGQIFVIGAIVVVKICPLIAQIHLAISLTPLGGRHSNRRQMAFMPSGVGFLQSAGGFSRRRSCQSWKSTRCECECRPPITKIWPPPA